MNLQKYKIFPIFAEIIEKMSAFKAYDFRGVYGVDFDLNTIYRFGYFLPKLLKTDKVLVGRDVRLSTPEIFEHLRMGINDAGADLYDMGLTTTPMVYYFTAKHHFEASVMITASHNPKEYNGLKVSRKEALPFGYDSGLSDLEELVLSDTPAVKATVPGKVVPHPVMDEYIEFLSQYQSDFSDLKIAVDCSNGMGSILAKKVIGEHQLYIHDTPDGSFPNHDPNPLEAENREDIENLVLSSKADVGILFDGDADRVVFIDEKGNFIPPDLIIAVMGHYFAEREKDHKGIYYIQDIRTSKSVTEYLTAMGFKPYIWRVGRAFAALKLREIDGLFGGEFAGHYYLKDFYYSDSAMVAVLIVLNVLAKLKKEGIPFSKLIDKIKVYHNSGEINFTLDRKQEAMEALKDHFSKQEKVLQLLDFDGYRLEFHDWWFNVRPSNTEPYLRLIVEAKVAPLLDLKIKEITEIINKFK